MERLISNGIFDRHLEEFIDTYYEDIYNEYCEVNPEEIHSDWMLEDAEDLDIFIQEHMDYAFIKFCKEKGYMNMITVDKQCKDILANQWLHSTEDGKHITEQYKAKKISKAEYLDYIYKQTEVWIDMLSSDELADFLKKQEYFDFNVSKQMAKLNEETKAAFIAEPMILKRIDSDGNHHFLLDAFKKPGDETIKQLPLDPDKANELLERLEGLNLYCMGMNWTKKPDSPSILIFGVESYCKDLREQLVKTYGINR